MVSEFPKKTNEMQESTIPNWVVSTLNVLASIPELNAYFNELQLHEVEMKKSTLISPYDYSFTREFGKYITAFNNGESPDGAGVMGALENYT